MLALPGGPEAGALHGLAAADQREQLLRDTLGATLAGNPRWAAAAVKELTIIGQPRPTAEPAPGTKATPEAAGESGSPRNAAGDGDGGGRHRRQDDVRERRAVCA